MSTIDLSTTTAIVTGVSRGGGGQSPPLSLPTVPTWSASPDASAT
jgi:hypothetical protein